MPQRINLARASIAAGDAAHTLRDVGLRHP
jgi:hypothetical protein